MTRAERLNVVLITDPGPDPDDVKVLLVLAILHKLKRVSLLAVVANGGGQPRARAALALCVLEHLGVTNVPVGIGSVGVPSAPQPHEYALAGIAGADARLERGHELLLRTIRGAPPKSVRVVNISSLRDMADIVATDPAAVLASVHTIAIQGGLESDPNSVSGWRPDTSVNNGFDLAAATHLHAFCFANELRMTVTSRFAVPLLPMQLAKSFATRTSCPVMRYLADAQSLGLEGLWVKLCEGRLPARCTKQWYFATFCGEDAQQFAENHREKLGKGAPVSHYLNGYVKPYDVVAVMTILPFCEHVFEKIGVRVPFPSSQMSSGTPQPSSQLAHSRTRRSWMRRLGSADGVGLGPGEAPPPHHLLLLTSADEPAQAHVLDLLRDTFHEVVLATRDRQRRSSASSSAGRSAKPYLACLMRKNSTSSLSPFFSASAPSSSTSSSRNSVFTSTSEPQIEESLRGSFGMSRTAGSGRDRFRLQRHSSATQAALTSARRASGSMLKERVRGATLEPEEVVQLLESALKSARERSRTATHVASVAFVSLMLCAFVASVIDSRLTGASYAGSNAAELPIYYRNDGYALRLHYYQLVGCIAVAALVLSLAPSNTDRRRAWLAAFIVAPLFIAAGAWLFLPRLITTLASPSSAISEVQSASDPQGRSAAFFYYARMVHLILRLLIYCGLWLVGISVVGYVRHSPHAVVRTLCVLVGLTMVLQGCVDIYILALEASSNEERPQYFAPALAAAAAISMLFGTWMLLPAARVRTQMLFARMGGRGAYHNPETAIAALIGHGGVLEERDPPSLVAGAVDGFQPVDLTVALLRRMGPVLFSSPDDPELHRARSHWPVRPSHPALPESRRLASFRKQRITDTIAIPKKAADVYVVSSPVDDAAQKLDSLCAWVGKFEAEHRRPPRVWLGSLCIDPSLSRVELLEHMPTYLARSERLLLLAGSHGITHLWSAVEVFVFRQMGGLVHNIDVEIVGAPPVQYDSDGIVWNGNSIRLYADSVVSAFDTFHAMFAQTTDEEKRTEVRARLLAAIEMTGVAHFNMVVREILPRARAAAAAQEALTRATSS